MKRVERNWNKSGYQCVVIMSDHGHRCGYVRVPTGHILHSVEYNDRTFKLSPYRDHNTAIVDIGKINVFKVFIGFGLDPESAFEVHGGITYSGGDGYPVRAHKSWWFGFDCAHYGDAPDISELSGVRLNMAMEYPSDGFVRSLEYCVSECENLVGQLIEADVMYRDRADILFRKFT